MITIKTEEDKTDIHKFLSSLSMKDYRVFLDHIVVSGEYVEDLNLVLGLMKSLLNLADLRGMKTVYGSNPAMFDLYKMLRFKKSAGETKKMYELSLEGYFTCENEEQ